MSPKSDLTPLEVPSNMRQPSRIASFLRDIPVIGMDYKLKREIDRQIASRPPNVLRHWENHRLDFYDILDDLILIKNFLKWEKPYFTPEDPVWLVFLDPSNDTLSDTCLVTIEDKYDVEFEAEFLKSRDFLLIQLFDFIASKVALRGE